MIEIERTKLFILLGRTKAMHFFQTRLRSCVLSIISIFALVFSLLAYPNNSGAQQIAPVLANLQINPPYSAYLSDYASPGSDKLQVNLFLKDLSKPNYPCRLRIKMEGFGITIQSKNDFYAPELLLNGGELAVFSGQDLAPYFNPQNLVFNGLNQTAFVRNGGKLPEGVYRFSVEVIDYYRKSLVSNSAIAVVSIFLAYPPIINQPINNSKVTALDPQNVIFQWTPRSTGSINAAYNTAYQFKLVELIPAERDPNDAIRNSRPIYEAFTDQTLLVYGITAPQLIPGNNYAVQVQAIEAEGKDLYINNGNSEVVKFTYGERCPSATNIMAELAGPNAIKLSWGLLPGQQAFTIRYREADKPNAKWFEQEVYTANYTLQGLRPAATYEFQVKAQCIYGYGDYSERQTFAIPNETFSQGDFVCGKADNLNALAQGEPLDALSQSMVFFAGKFPIVVSKATGQNGVFTGTGTVGVPFLNALSFQVEFRDIKINRDLKLTDGKVIFTKQPLEQAIAQAIASITVTPDEYGNITAISSNGLPTIIDAAISPWPGSMPVYNAQTKSVKFTASVNGDEPKEITLKLVDGQPPLTFQDKNQETFKVDEKGNVTYVGKIPPSQLMSSGSTGGTNYAIDNSRGTVTFSAHQQQQYGFDAYDGQLAQQSQAYANDYKPLNDGNSNHKTSWKSLESRQPDKVLATLNLTDPKIDPKKLIFKTGTGETIGSTQMGQNQYSIGLLGALSNNVSEIYAVYPKGDNNTEDPYLGKLNLYSYSKLSKKLVVVPVNGAGAGIDKTTLQNGLNEIYRTAVVEWQVELAASFNTDAKFDQLDNGNSSAMSAYTEGQKQLVKAYKDAGNKLESDAYYIFIVKSLSNGDAGPCAACAGYMVRGGQVGFVASGDVRTVAHELGHGAFKLQHSWDEYGLTKGSTKNLMDYGSGTELWYGQWRYMRNPDVIFRPLEGDEQGAVKLLNKDLILRLLKDIKNSNAKKLNAFDDYVSNLNLKDKGFDEIVILNGLKIEVGFIARRAKTMLSINESNNIGSMYSSKKKIDNLVFYEFSLVENLGIFSNTYKKIEPVFEFYILEKDTAFFEEYLEFNNANIIVEKDEEIAKPKGYELKVEDLKKIFPNVKSEKAKEVTSVINKYSDRFEINTPLKMAHFLGQIGAETGLTDLLENSYTKDGILNSKKTRTLRLKDGEYVLKYCDLFEGYNKISDGCAFPHCEETIIVPEKDRFKEGQVWYASTSFMKANNILKPKIKYYKNSPNNLEFFDYVYACQLENGNISSHDGSRFRGRGFIQLTGLVNYKEFQRKWNLVFSKDNPKNFICRSDKCDANLELLNTDSEISMLAAMAFWKDAGANMQCTDIDNETIKSVSKIVNGALHGIIKRISYTKTAYNILNDEK